LRVVFMGTPEFAVSTLRMLLERHDVVAVYTRPDRPSGRGRTTSPSAVKSLAMDAGVPVRQPQRLDAAREATRLWDDRLDVVVVAAYGTILPPSVLEVPRFGCLNVHASLLPRWRGAAPIQRAILACDRLCGVSIMRMDEGLDTGDWCLQESVDVDEKTSADLTAELAELGAGAMGRALDAIVDGAVTWHAQDETAATYAAKVGPGDVALDPTLTVDAALARVRASGASAPCRVVVADRTLTVLAGHRCEGTLASGEASCVGELMLGTADGTICLERVVPAGRAPMSGESFTRGARLGTACRWGRP
jgi:methionyl-tRNA formyltransferase